MELSQYVNGVARGLPGWWPQGDIGIVLWLLSGGRQRMAERRRAHATVHGRGGHDLGGALESGGDDVRAAHPGTATMVRAGGMSRRGSHGPCAVAQDRPVRPLRLVRRPARRTFCRRSIAKMLFCCEENEPGTMAKGRRQTVASQTTRPALICPFGAGPRAAWMPRSVRRPGGQTRDFADWQTRACVSPRDRLPRAGSGRCRSRHGTTIVAGGRTPGCGRGRCRR